jgi:uncharacterized protein
MFRALLLGLAALTGAAQAAAPDFPPLTGRIVDEAGILPAQAETELAAQLAAHEHASGNQVVVVTLKSLRGVTIEDYGYQLGRHWGIGQKGRNNGALLIVAPSERKMRIEVGYGLEGVLTDAVSRDIIERLIKPPFRQGNYEQGIRAGVDAILAALSGEYQAPPPPATASGNEGLYGFLVFAVFAANALFGALARRATRGARLLVAAGAGALAGFVAWVFAQILLVALVLGVVVFLFMLLAGGRIDRGGWGGSGGSSGGGWSSGGDGGFSGGGGGFGGGGASGDW